MNNNVLIEFLNKNKIANLFFHFIQILIPAFIFHLLFSKYGLNPTDDGFILAYSRRLIEGQIPHLDFISIRPVLSPIVHIPFVLFGGEYTFLLDRFFVWFQLGLIAYLLVEILYIYSYNLIDKKLKFLLFLVAFMINAHTFPIMAWHTIDGMFFSTIGFYIIAKFRKNNIKYIGYLIAGLSVLCKQNFVFLLPLLCLIFREDNLFKQITLLLIPSIIYLIYLIIFGALDSAIMQFNSQTNFLIQLYNLLYNAGTLVGICIGFFSIYLFEKKKFKVFEKHIIINILILSILLITPYLYIKYYILNSFKWTYSYIILGITLGQLFYIYCEYNTGFFKVMLNRIVIFILFLSAIISISFGYPHPSLLIGSLIICQFFIFSRVLNSSLKTKYILIAPLFLITFICFLFIRYNFIYVEQPAKFLNYSIDNVIKGTKGIYTNYNMYEYANELKEIISEVEQRGKKFSIVPYFTAYWVKSDEKNLLPIDLIQAVELGNNYLKGIIFQRIRTNVDVIYICSKYDTFLISKGYYEYNEYTGSWILSFVEENFPVIKETKYFKVYGNL